MVRTYGLTHINLIVRDVERSLRFRSGCAIDHTLQLSLSATIQ
jgi:catechol 2,3-dioxygenase-like lactoylglutathione lyase family enzyme